MKKRRFLFGCILVLLLTLEGAGQMLKGSNTSKEQEKKGKNESGDDSDPQKNRHEVKPPSPHPTKSAQGRQLGARPKVRLSSSRGAEGGSSSPELGSAVDHSTHVSFVEAEKEHRFTVEFLEFRAQCKNKIKQQFDRFCEASFSGKSVYSQLKKIRDQILKGIQKYFDDYYAEDIQKVAKEITKLKLETKMGYYKAHDHLKKQSSGRRDQEQERELQQKELRKNQQGGHGSSFSQQKPISSSSLLQSASSSLQSTKAFTFFKDPPQCQSFLKELIEVILELKLMLETLSEYSHRRVEGQHIQVCWENLRMAAIFLAQWMTIIAESVAELMRKRLYETNKIEMSLLTAQNQFQIVKAKFDARFGSNTIGTELLLDLAEVKEILAQNKLSLQTAVETQNDEALFLKSVSFIFEDDDEESEEVEWQQVWQTNMYSYPRPPSPPSPSSPSSPPSTIPPPKILEISIREPPPKPKVLLQTKNGKQMSQNKQVKKKNKKKNKKEETAKKPLKIGMVEQKFALLVAIEKMEKGKTNEQNALMNPQKHMRTLEECEKITVKITHLTQRAKDKSECLLHRGSKDDDQDEHLSHLLFILEAINLWLSQVKASYDHNEKWINSSEGQQLLRSIERLEGESSHLMAKIKRHKGRGDFVQSPQSLTSLKKIRRLLEEIGLSAECIALLDLARRVLRRTEAEIRKIQYRAKQLFLKNELSSHQMTQLKSASQKMEAFISELEQLLKMMEQCVFGEEDEGTLQRHKLKILINFAGKIFHMITASIPNMKIKTQQAKKVAKILTSEQRKALKEQLKSDYYRAQMQKIKITNYFDRVRKKYEASFLGIETRDLSFEKGALHAKAIIRLYNFLVRLLSRLSSLIKCMESYKQLEDTLTIVQIDLLQEEFCRISKFVVAIQHYNTILKIYGFVAINPSSLYQLEPKSNLTAAELIRNYEADESAEDGCKEIVQKAKDLLKVLYKQNGSLDEQIGVQSTKQMTAEVQSILEGLLREMQSLEKQAQEMLKDLLDCHFPEGAPGEKMVKIYSDFIRRVRTVIIKNCEKIFDYTLGPEIRLPGASFQSHEQKKKQSHKKKSAKNKHKLQKPVLDSHELTIWRMYQLLKLFFVVLCKLHYGHLFNELPGFQHYANKCEATVQSSLATLAKLIQQSQFASSERSRGHQFTHFNAAMVKLYAIFPLGQTDTELPLLTLIQIHSKLVQIRDEVDLRLFKTLQMSIAKTIQQKCAQMVIKLKDAFSKTHYSQVERQELREILIVLNKYKSQIAVEQEKLEPYIPSNDDQIMQMSGYYRDQTKEINKQIAFISKKL